MKKLLIILPLLFFCGVSRAETIPVKPPDHFSLECALRDANSFNYLWAILIVSPLGTSIVVGDTPIALEKFSDQEILTFWNSAREVLNSFRLGRGNKETGDLLFSVNLEIDNERIGIVQKVSDLSKASGPVRNLIELCKQYIPNKDISN